MPLTSSPPAPFSFDGRKDCTNQTIWDCRGHHHMFSEDQSLLNFWKGGLERIDEGGNSLTTTMVTDFEDGMEIIDELLSLLSDSGDNECDEPSKLNNMEAPVDCMGYHMQNVMSTFFSDSSTQKLSTTTPLNPSLEANVTSYVDSLWYLRNADFMKPTTCHRLTTTTKHFNRQILVQIDRLQRSMRASSISHAALRDWDRRLGLSAAHARTMVNSARSRKQLMDGVVLKKWNGIPLLKTAHSAVAFEALYYDTSKFVGERITTKSDVGECFIDQTTDSSRKHFVT